MTKSEEFIQKTYDVASELKIPLFDDTIHNKVKLNSNKAITSIKFVYDTDEAIIRGFLGLADYFHSIIIREKDKFYIPNGKQLFSLEAA
ncbi:MAG: hypothetical protein ACFFA8_09575 [Promethearchaeota archaeon]